MTGRTARELRTAWWALRALRRARADLRRDALARPALPPVPAPPGVSRTLERALYAGRATCLERASVRQAWLAAQGRRHDLVIGVRSPDDFAAHAWLEGDPAEESAGYAEIARLAP